MKKLLALCVFTIAGMCSAVPMPPVLLEPVGLLLYRWDMEDIPGVPFTIGVPLPEGAYHEDRQRMEIHWKRRDGRVYYELWAYPELQMASR